MAPKGLSSLLEVQVGVVARLLAAATGAVEEDPARYDTSHNYYYLGPWRDRAVACGEDIHKTLERESTE